MKNTASKGHTSAISLIREQMLGKVCEIVLVQYHTKVSYVLRQLLSKVDKELICHTIWSRRLKCWCVKGEIAATYTSNLI